MMKQAMRAAAMAGIMAAGLALGACESTAKDQHNLQNGFAAYNQRKFTEAEKAASTYIQKFPDDKFVDEAYYLRGISRQSSGDRAGAEKDLKLALEKGDRPDLKAKSNRALGDIAYDRKDWNGAIGFYRASIAAAVGADPKKPAASADVGVYEKLANALQATGKWDLARPEIDKALALRPDAATAERLRSRRNARAYELQYGSFTTIDPARNMIAALKQQGVTALVVNEDRDGKVVWHVRSGTYVTLAEAETARQGMAAKKPAPIVVP